MLLRSRVVLLFEVEQNDVAGVARREAGDLQVVVHQSVRLGERMVLCRRRTASGSSNRGPT